MIEKNKQTEIKMKSQPQRDDKKYVCSFLPHDYKVSAAAGRVAVRQALDLHKSCSLLIFFL